MSHALQVIIEQDKDGYFAYVPELKGCHTQGDSMEEVMQHIEESVELYLSTLSPVFETHRETTSVPSPRRQNGTS